MGIIFITAFNTNAYSQSFWEWTDPDSLTDSVSNNINAFLYYDHGSGGEFVYMVWEKSYDSVSTSIYFKDLLLSSPAMEVLSDSGIHYKNPKIIYAKYGLTADSVFYLIYETDQNGNSDIYYITYLNDGTFSNPTPLLITDSNESQLAVVTQSEWWDQSAYVANSIAYIRNDSLYVMNLFKEGTTVFWGQEELIDFPNCSKPVFNESGNGNELKYLKSNGIDKHIFAASCDSYGNWYAPTVVYDSTDCRNLSHILHTGDFIWSTYLDTSWLIMQEDWQGNFSTLLLSDSIPLDPTAVTMAIGVETSYWDNWVASPYLDNDVTEIFMNEWPGSNYFINFSNLGTNNRNPNTFTGEHDGSGYYCWYDYLVWESYRNDHWQIWYSKVHQCAGNIGEEKGEEAFISIHPNPFIQETTLKFTLDTRSNVIADVYDNRGAHIASISNRAFDQGKHQLRWDGSGLAAGVYIVKMTVGDMIYSSKIVKTD